MDEWNFILPESPSQRPQKRRRSSTSEAANQQLWVDQYEPNQLEDICVKPEKVKELRIAIEESSIGNRRGRTKILLLTGGSGVGKSTLARLMCKTMGYDITEWIHPASHYDPSDNYVNTMTLFSQFMTSSITRGQQRQIIFVDDIPDFTTEDNKQKFHAILKMCIEASVNFLVIIVATDAWMENASNDYRSYDSRLNRTIDIIPREFDTDSRVRQIKLNPVAKTTMTKILKHIVAQEQTSISKDQLEDIIEKSDGDIRAAINNLQFHTISGAKIRRTVPKKKSNEKAPFDEKLGPLTLFHALGKVLYAKRNPNGTYESKPEHILAKLPVANDMFIDYLHQNYTEFFPDIDSCANLLNYLSDSDTIRTQNDWQDKDAPVYRGLVAVNGIMINPPKRQNSYRQFQFRKSEILDVKQISQQNKQDLAYQELMASVKARSKLYDAEDSMDYEEDPIQDFSEDEFDDVYGDDEDLVAFLDY